MSAPVEPDWARSNWQSYCMTLPDQLDQLELMQGLLDQGISTRRGIMNSHLEPAYAAENSHRVSGDLTNSVSAQNRTVILPLFVQMTDGELDAVVDAIAASRLRCEPVIAKVG
jgi:dTDP-4-amino-4,6-dideoxygalactose transaminase